MGAPDGAAQAFFENPGADPYLRVYRVRVERAHDKAGVEGAPKIRSAQQVIGEQRHFAWAIHVKEITSAPAEIMDEVVEAQRLGLTPSRRLLSARPFLWLNDVDRIAGELPVPPHQIGQRLPFPVVWWTFEGAHPLEINGAPRAAMADGFLLIEDSVGFSVSVIGQMGGDLRNPTDWGILATFGVRFGARWPDDVRPSARGILGRVLAMLAFLEAPFVVTSGTRPQRRKGQHGRPPSPEEVRFVRLREAVHAPGDSTEHGSRAWTVRWIVRGHLRAQWYPSSQTHRLIWIAPYSKGPDWAPMKEPAYAVVR